MLEYSLPISSPICSRHLYSTPLFSVSVSVTQSSQVQSNLPILLQCSLLQARNLICLIRSLHDVAMSCLVRLGNSKLVLRRDPYYEVQSPTRILPKLFTSLYGKSSDIATFVTSHVRFSKFDELAKASVVLILFSSA